MTTPAPFKEVPHRGLITIAIMLATIMQVLDTTIANVALPTMTGDLGASQDTINWVLTSYIVAAAIMTPVTGWLADRFGRRELFLVSIVGFTITSMFCGLSWSLESMVAFRVLQGLFGAAIVPLSQTFLLDINPKERHGSAMAVWGAGIMVGPIIGPTLGGWLTEAANWRWVFFINLPVGILAFLGCAGYLPRIPRRLRGFDFFGFAMLSLGVGALQLMLDRGAEVGWFEAMETWVYLGLIIAGLWVFVVHCMTAEHPFVDLKMFKDLNFVMGLLFIFLIGITLFSGLALLPPLLQNLMGYPVIYTGVVMAPRGVATMLSMVVVGRLVGKFDSRILVLFGTGLMAYSLYMMTGFTLGMDSTLIVWSGAIQGFGMGFVFVPLTTLAFATIENKYRTDATSIFSLVRNMGQGVGISLVTAVLASMIQVNHAELGARLTATSGAVMNLVPSLLTGAPQIVAQINGLVSQQAAMLSYLDDFQLMMWVSLATVPVILLLRGNKARPASNAPKKSAEELALERAHAMAE